MKTRPDSRIDSSRTRYAGRTSTLKQEKFYTWTTTWFRQSLKFLLRNVRCLPELCPYVHFHVSQYSWACAYVWPRPQISAVCKARQKIFSWLSLHSLIVIQNVTRSCTVIIRLCILIVHYPTQEAVFRLVRTMKGKWPPFVMDNVNAARYSFEKHHATYRFSSKEVRHIGWIERIGILSS